MNSIMWTDEEVAVLRKMAEAGKKMAEIELVLVGRSRNAIDNKASELGISLAGKKPEIDMEAFSRIMGESWKPQDAE